MPVRRSTRIKRDCSLHATHAAEPDNANVIVGQYAPAVGGKTEVLRTDAKVPRGMEWTGGRIQPGEYTDFRFLAAPKTAGQAVFRAYQTYADGRTKQWAGPPERPSARSTATD